MSDCFACFVQRRSPLHVATQSNSVAAVNLLLEKGANKDLQDIRVSSGLTVLA